ncbi:MAG: hypothetical protein IJF25_00310 [Oscillospiraceae bacterium]|nr:hypothetical protein [Oscillospiraceae bacterium]
MFGGIGFAALPLCTACCGGFCRLLSGEGCIGGFGFGFGFWFCCWIELCARCCISLTRFTASRLSVSVAGS